MQSSVSFFVKGTPAPQGSKFPVKRGNRIVLVEAAKGFAEWRNDVILAAAHAKNNWFVHFTEPIHVDLDFVLRKPENTKYPDYPVGKPDLDKLVRNTCDGLTNSALLSDDSRIVALHAYKRWAHPGEPTGCWVKVEVYNDKVTTQV